MPTKTSSVKLISPATVGTKALTVVESVATVGDKAPTFEGGEVQPEVQDLSADGEEKNHRRGSSVYTDGSARTCISNTCDVGHVDESVRYIHPFGGDGRSADC